MQGGLLKSASAVAIIAAAGLFGASPAKAADLGGDCCADLEERVAELEATTVRKGNRKVSLTISGFVSTSVVFWNDGTQKDMYIGDPGNGGSRFRFVGTAKISPQMSAGFLYEFAANANSGLASNQLNGGDRLGNSGAPQSAALAPPYQGCGNAVAATTISATNTSGCATVRDATVWLRHNQLGMIKVGHGSTATDNLILIDVGGQGVAGTPDIALHQGGFLIRGKNSVLSGVAWNGAIRGHESFDTARRDHVLYETPTLLGFSLQAAVANDNYWDVALRYAGEFGGFRVAAGVGYLEDTGFNAPFQQNQAAGFLCTTNCDVKSKEIKGSASVMHVPTGLFVTGAAANRELSGSFSNTAAQYSGPDVRMYHIAAGIGQNWFGIGKTVLFGEYGEHKGGLAQLAFLGAAGYAANPIGTGSGFCTSIDGVNTGGAASCDSKVTTWGINLVQYIDAAAMEVFVGYKNYSLSTNGFLNGPGVGAAQGGGNASLNKNAGGVNDMSAVMAGAKISF